MTNRSTAALLAALVLAAPLGAAAQEVADTVEELASEQEVASVRESIARIGCEAETIEKEDDDLYEIDDAECEIGQYDIKLDGAFEIISMTAD